MGDKIMKFECDSCGETIVIKNNYSNEPFKMKMKSNVGYSEWRYLLCDSCAADVRLGIINRRNKNG